MQDIRDLGFHPWVGKITWKRKQQPTPAPLPGESQGQRSLAGWSTVSQRVGHNCSDSACKENRVLLNYVAIKIRILTEGFLTLEGSGREKKR